jgi:hypothetical protein
MRKIIFFSVMLSALLILNGCSLEDQENFHFVALPITSVEMPVAFELNKTYDIKVKFQRNSDCTFFEGFDVNNEERTVRNVSAIGSMLTDNDNCTEISQEIEESFRFIVLYNETYLFKFYQGKDENNESQYLEIEVPVN